MVTSIKSNSFDPTNYLEKKIKGLEAATIRFYKHGTAKISKVISDIMEVIHIITRFRDHRYNKET
jgi:hypothetical protein